MANWTKNEPQGSNQRKKWNLENRTSLNNLKYHIAEDGCSEVQYDIGRQLLNENQENGSIDNYCQGVQWLLRAAQQGHEGSIILLRECYKTGRGISDSNECEVRACLKMSPAERAARKAARELFLCLSNGEEYVTAAQLESKMREIYRLQKKKRKPETGSRERNGISCSPQVYRRQSMDGEVFTEANLISAAVNYSNGHLPNLNQALTVTAPHPQSLDHVPLLYRPIVHPLLFWSLLYYRLIKLIGALPDFSYNLRIPLLLLLYLMVSTETVSIAMFVPTALYFISMITMIIMTFRMLKAKHEFIDFRIWSGLFLRFGNDNLDTESSEAQFLRNNLKPFMYFFGALIVNLMLYPLISDQWIPHSEITVVSFALVFTTMFAFMNSSYPVCPDYLILLSFGVNVLAKYPYEMDSVVNLGWRFLDLEVPTFHSFVIGNGIEFCLNCRALLYLIIPIFLIQLASRENWRGIYKFLIPHCVTLSWLQICISSSQYSTMFGLVRAVLGLAGLFLFLPIFGIVTVLLPIFTAVEWLSLSNPTVKLSIIALTALSVLIGCSLLAANNRTQKYLTFIQVVICCCVVIFHVTPLISNNLQIPTSEEIIYNTLDNAMPTNFETDSMTLSWEMYHKYCQQPAWEHVNKINARIRCSHLDGTTIKWDGIVSDIELAKIRNTRAEVLSYVYPTFIREMITCYYGEKNLVGCAPTENCEDIKDFIESGRQCNLDKWNIYDYEITVRMNSGILKTPTEIILNAEHNFGNFSIRLNHSDRIWYIGKLKQLRNNRHNDRYRPGKGNQIVVDLHAIGCITCLDKELTYAKTNSDIELNAVFQDFFKCMKYVLNILFNPLVTFK